MGRDGNMETTGRNSNRGGIDLETKDQSVKSLI